MIIWKAVLLFIAKRGRWLWQKIPVRIEHKIKLKNYLFNNFGFLFAKTGAYRNWKRLNGLNVSTIDWLDRAVSYEEHAEPYSSYIPFKKVSGKVDINTSVVAFYLPQFHTIPENDDWWGKGFTEWTNVRPAKPLYIGHYQPHIPDMAIGYYDLLNKDVQRKQIELARNYGVSGFCYYFYWFSGHRLLESPLLSLLEDKSLDFPFCLCWANENWSRRWDGLENELLITQRYSEADDLAFIKYISKYIKDRRYIKFDGKPLVLVYRPSLFPNIKKTAKRWRDWCLSNGVGEILLGYTQSFEMVDPQKYGFDLAIEFPPNGTNPPDVTEKVVPYSSDFQGMVYDWSVYVERSKSYKALSYPLIRSVCPSWDNTARKKNRSISFINSSPCGFQQWLCSALIDTQKASNYKKFDAVFVNAWNEWAEGAHLEPDERYGFAWLEAVRIARIRAELITNPSNYNRNLERVAFVIHVFYIDIFEEIFQYLLLEKDRNFKIFVTVTSESDKADVCRRLEGAGFDFEIALYENRGRDVLPFLRIMRRVISQGYGTFIKIHTKKTTHRSNGEEWRRDLYAKILSSDSLNQALSILEHNPDIGVIGPEGHVLPLKRYFGSNADKVFQIGERLGVSKTEVGETKFIAGTMFIAKTAALIPLIEIGLDENDFELECGQIDGTLAHAVERCISVSAFSVNMKLITINNKEQKHYQFADSIR